MNRPQTKRLRLFETTHRPNTIIGPIECVNVTALRLDDPMPIFIAVAALFCQTPDGKWVLQHIMVEEEERRRGFAEEVVSHYEQRLGSLGGAFVSDSGEAFAKAYIAKHGARPRWQVGPNVALDALLAPASARQGGTGGEG